LAARGLWETDWLAKLMLWLCAAPGRGVKRYNRGLGGGSPAAFPVCGRT
jgi:hypothetical protein